MPMKINMLNIKFHFNATKLLILMFVLLCLPLNSYSSQLFYTIQTGSFQSIDDAQKQYESLVQQFDGKEIDHLRIEKIGKFHSVRLGKYNNKDEVKKYLNSKKKRLRSHIVMKAYYLDERIEKIYVPTKTKADSPQAEAEPANEQGPVNIQTQVVGKVVDNVDKQSDAKPLDLHAPESIYTIQTGSFQNIGQARNQYDSLMQRFKDNEIDYLRIEKIGKFHSVRLGKFDKRDEAEKYFSLNKEQLKSSIVMKAYYKEDRIEKLYVSSKKGIDEHQTIAEPVTKSGPVSSQPQVAQQDVNNADKKADANLRAEKIKSTPMVEKENIIPTKTDANPDKKEIEATSALAENKRDKVALTALKAKLEARPEDPEINGRYGTMLFRLKQPAEAIPYLRKAAELSPDVPEYNISIGYCYLLLSKFNEAVDEFHKAVNMSPSHVGALTGLGISYSELGEKDKAMGVYDKLKTLDSVLTKILLQIIEET